MADIGYAYPYLFLYIEPHVIYIYPTAKLHIFILRQLLLKVPFRETNNFIREFCDKCIKGPTDYENRLCDYSLMFPLSISIRFLSICLGRVRE